MSSDTVPVTQAGGKYLLVKRGLYYGPDNRGYTGIKERAGRYHAHEADALSGVEAIHEDEAPMFSPNCWQDVKVEYLLGRIAELERRLTATPTPSPAMPSREEIALDCYDAGLLGDGGGGNVEWWQDYIRAELCRAHEFYAAQFAALTSVDRASEADKLREALRECRDQLWLLAKDPENNPWIKQADAALSSIGSEAE